MHKASRWLVLISGGIKLICSICWFVIGLLGTFPGGSDLITAFIFDSLSVYMVLLSGVGSLFIMIVLLLLPVVLLALSLAVIVWSKKSRYRIPAIVCILFVAFLDFICSAIMMILFAEIYMFTFILSLVIDILTLVSVSVLLSCELKSFFCKNKKI